MKPEEVLLLLDSLPRQPRRTVETRDRRSSTTDLLRLYLQDIGRVDLLTNEEEVTLARLVQRGKRCCTSNGIWPAAMPPLVSCTASRNCSAERPTNTAIGPPSRNGLGPPT